MLSDKYLLLEESVASSDFRWWFLSQIGIEFNSDLSDARRSVKIPNGESDLEMELQGSGGTAKVIIENKVDAAFNRPNPNVTLNVRLHISVVASTKRASP